MPEVLNKCTLHTLHSTFNSSARLNDVFIAQNSSPAYDIVFHLHGNGEMYSLPDLLHKLDGFMILIDMLETKVCCAPHMNKIST